MTFAMLTTFFGEHSFGGDAAFVDRLSRSLARHGHDVHVIYCRDAFNLVRGDQTPRPYEAPPGVTIHALSSRAGALSPLGTHQTGLPTFKSRKIGEILKKIKPDVIHVHNLSLIGGPGLLGELPRDPIRIMTTHEHWLVCPLHVLWKFGSEVCEARDCVRCCLHAKKPPQLWRNTDLMAKSLRNLDALICPSRSTQREHARRLDSQRTEHLPYFLPEDYTGLPHAETPSHGRPYVAAAGRLELIKGFQDAIAAMRSLPHLDLRIAGTGLFEADLRSLAADLPNVFFEGRLDASRLAALFRGARAVVVPSLVYETFGYVVLESFAEGTPVIVRDLGALPELIEESDGGLVFDSQEGLVECLDRVSADGELRDRLGTNGRASRNGIWSEEEHLKRYFDLIADLRRKRSPRGSHPSHDFFANEVAEFVGPDAR